VQKGALIETATSGANRARRVWIGLGVVGAIAAVMNQCLDRSTYPSQQAAEGILRWVIDGNWKAFRLDGTPEVPKDLGLVESVDCQKDAHIKSDFPLFACVYRFKSETPPRDYIGVVGALYRRGDDLPNVDGYIVYPWAIPDQQKVLASRGIAFPLTANP
jgi:hypothetical protein